MYKLLIISFSLLLFVTGCSHTQIERTTPFNGVTSIYFGYRHNNYNDRFSMTEHDVIYLLDDEFQNEKDAFSLSWDRENAILISHKDYLKHQKEVDSLVKIPVVQSDSLTIFIDTFENGAKIGYYSIISDQQISYYIKFLDKILKKYNHSFYMKHYKEIIDNY